MDKMVVTGGQKLKGTVAISGAKNSALPILFSSLLAKGKHRFTNVPRLQDIYSTKLLLEQLGCEVEWSENEFTVDVKDEAPFEAPYDLVRKMRASVLCLGPLLARRKKAIVSLPGGCAIGSRPIDQHLEGFKALGAKVVLDGGNVCASAEDLKGETILFDGVTVGGTENVLMAAVLTPGDTIIENAAKEPEIVDLANYLRKMGAKISGAGTSLIHVKGVEELKPVNEAHAIIPDRIEAGTFLIAGAITGGEVRITDCVPEHIDALIRKLQESGFNVEVGESEVFLSSPSSGSGDQAQWKAVDVTTAPHPGFPTDLQAQFMALMTQAEGTSVISENIFENRFMHVQELMRLGADITPKTRVAVVRGRRGGLKGAPVMATDLRASASLILAGLVAEGETSVSRIYHLDRGYEKIEKKLQSLGALVERVKE